jgi:hypothetical protein
VLKEFSILGEDLFSYSKVIRKQFVLCISTHVMKKLQCCSWGILKGQRTKLTSSLLITEGRYWIMALNEYCQKQSGRLKTLYRYLQARTKNNFYKTGQNNRLPGRECNLEYPTFSRKCYTVTVWQGFGCIVASFVTG